MSEQYLVAYFDINPNAKPCYDVVNETEVWKIVDRAHENDTKIVIHKLSECLLDWS